MYLTIKTIHMTCAMLSLTGFLLRSYLMIIGSPLLKQRISLVLPHLIDSVFLLSGFIMAFMVNFGLFNQPWLSMKVLMLMFYLLFVGLTLSRGKTRSIRVLCFFLALGSFAYIVGIAINKTPLSWFSLL